LIARTFYNMRRHLSTILFFFFNDTATTQLYTLSLTTLFRSPVDEPARRAGRRDRPARHRAGLPRPRRLHRGGTGGTREVPHQRRDRKSTRLNSSHVAISYAVFCLKKKKKNSNTHSPRPSTAT